MFILSKLVKIDSIISLDVNIKGDKKKSTKRKNTKHNLSIT